MVLNLSVLFLVIYENKEFEMGYKINIQRIVNENSELSVETQPKKPSCTFLPCMFLELALYHTYIYIYNLMYLEIICL